MTSILVVDDDVNLLNGLRRVLRDQPYDLFVANSAEMAISMLQRHHFELVVSDQQMSGKTGNELIAWIAENSPETVRIMLTGRPDVEVMTDAINRGRVFKFLTKPCHAFELAMVIREGLQLAATPR
ncbi:response regulator [Stieleria varia]|uniref:Hydrogenase transcriptional regulatory protein hupR1 n=1 Tax=Stieleria varia TaxID=2528005 RepID=A0A5C5ZQD9_9BACT|nr:response regulator [Stieleria varia]TWT89470.1 Hydrogenase transcriptional regulatory protein hupR1 [Stieleria varia]